MKRILLALLIILGLLFGIIILLQKRGLNINQEGQPTGSLPDTGNTQFAPNPQVATATQITQEDLSNSDRVTFGVLRDEAPISYAIQNNTLLMATVDGKILRSKNNKEEKIAELDNETILSASFSTSGTWAIVRYGEAAAAKVAALDMTNGVWTPFPLNSISAQFSPNKPVAAVFGERDGKLGLWLIDFRGKKPSLSLATNLNALDVETDWIDDDTVILWSKGANKANGNIWTYDAKNGLRLIKHSIPGLSVKAFGNGYYAQFSSGGIGKRGGNLAIFDKFGNKITDLYTLTLPEKCAPWQPSTDANASDTAAIICANPKNQDLLQSQFLPEAYQNGQFQGNDEFFMVSLPSLSSKIVYRNEFAPVDVWNLSSEKSSLLMTDAYSGKLFGLILP